MVPQSEGFAGNTLYPRSPLCSHPHLHHTLRPPGTSGGKKRPFGDLPKSQCATKRHELTAASDGHLGQRTSWEVTQTQCHCSSSGPEQVCNRVCSGGLLPVHSSTNPARLFSWHHPVRKRQLYPLLPAGNKHLLSLTPCPCYSHSRDAGHEAVALPTLEVVWSAVLHRQRSAASLADVTRATPLIVTPALAGIVLTAVNGPYLVRRRRHSTPTRYRLSLRRRGISP